MAIGRISGPMLFPNLERQGVDLAFQSNLLYLDVNNLRVGVINSSPQYAFDSSGNVKLANIVILGNTITSNTGKINLGSTANITIAGGVANNVLYTDGNGNLNWGQISDLDLSWDNLTVTSGNAQTWYATSLNSTEANLTAITVTNLSVGNILTTSGNVTANISGNINGTFGNFTSNVTADYFVGNIASDSTTVSGNVSANLLIGNIITQQITSPIGDLHFSAATNDPNNIIRFDSVSAFDIPSGNTAQRPPNPDFGLVRYNTDLGSVEWWGGSQWVAGSNLISTQQINPDGISDTYTLSEATVENAILVNINGTIQQAGAGAYSVTGDQITFAEIPLVTDIIEIRFLASGVAALTFNFANIAGNVSPSANVTYDLGSPTKRWKDLWLSGNTINLGSASLSAVGNTIQLPAGSTVGGANIDATFATVNANVVAANAAIVTANTAMKSYVDQGLADALFAANSYGNAIVQVYLPLDPTITTIQANLGAYQTYANANVVATQANLDAFQTFSNSNSATQAISINSLNANVGAYQTYANANVVAIQANLGAYQTYANANVVAIQANLGAYQTYANANVVAIQANIGAFYNYANAKIGTNSNGNLVVLASTISTTTTTGALVVNGGVGVAGNINVGENVQVGNIRIAASDFYSSFTANGWQRFPGGLIMQWGSLPTTSATTSANITFPIPFPNAVFSVTTQATESAGDVDGFDFGVGVIYAPATVNGFSVSKIANRGVYWFAIGN
jgi:hypothetical protein